MLDKLPISRGRIDGSWDYDYDYDYDYRTRERKTQIEAAPEIVSCTLAPTATDKVDDLDFWLR